MAYYTTEWNGNVWTGATCDHCGQLWEHHHEGWTLMPDECAMWQELDNCGWTSEGNAARENVLFCEDCWYYDDEDVFKLRPERLNKFLKK